MSNKAAVGGALVRATSRRWVHATGEPLASKKEIFVSIDDGFMWTSRRTVVFTHLHQLEIAKHRGREVRTSIDQIVQQHPKTDKTRNASGRGASYLRQMKSGQPTERIPDCQCKKRSVVLQNPDRKTVRDTARTVVEDYALHEIAECTVNVVLLASEHHVDCVPKNEEAACGMGIQISNRILA
ncbi:hypothetical protein NEOLEDRAFT_1152187 [Neolentinus lepideus HHB14362 ss-1]|uniref:Uncharacterized protein n=1 Tax=Neolentinus lepideus HHB14362 ss-1 TaxID=1314782 RepID=A0A165N1G6_9AGAM|nr:hypothetical protein NEOLEDRAFT_1152187 [Neolentinus lepideus HHB14362 ss-1]